jgi:hypothetical protein
MRNQTRSGGVHRPRGQSRVRRRRRRRWQASLCLFTFDPASDQCTLSHICCLHFSHSPANTKPSPYSHCYSTWYSHFVSRNNPQLTSLQANPPISSTLTSIQTSYVSFSFNSLSLSKKNPIPELRELPPNSLSPRRPLCRKTLPPTHSQQPPPRHKIFHL